MGRFADALRQVAEITGSAMALPGGEEMDFVDDAQLDPSQVEFREPPSLRGLAQRGASWELPNWGDAMPPGTIPNLGLGGLMQLAGLRDFGGGSPLGRGGGGGVGGFSASPPGEDWRGKDLTPTLANRQGITGVPPAVRLLLQAERALGVPGLSDAVVSDYRTAAQQYAMDPDQNGIGSSGQAVAPVGSSYHQQGEAFDISASFLAQNPRVRPWLEDRGFVWDVGGEPWHAHYVGTGQRVGGSNPVSRMAPPQRKPQQPNRVPVPTFTSNRPRRRPTVQSPTTPYLRQRR